MGKSASVTQNLYALDMFKTHDIYMQAGQILFDPYTTMAELWDNYHHMIKYDWIISKGVFTEMFAATGTPFQNKITKNNMVVSQNQSLGNHSYKIQDKRARQVYDALKLWHTANMRIYDKVIDPLTSPKALNSDEMKLFYDQYMNIRHKDLAIMQQVLSLVNKNKDACANVRSEIENSKEFFNQIENNIDVAYKHCKMVYDAAINPFIQTGQR
jgi:hypothetical protein